MVDKNKDQNSLADSHHFDRSTDIMIINNKFNATESVNLDTMN